MELLNVPHAHEAPGVLHTARRSTTAATIPIWQVTYKSAALIGQRKTNGVRSAPVHRSLAFGDGADRAKSRCRVEVARL